MGVIFQTNIVDFLLVSVFLGGGAAYLVGRAIALSWAPLRMLVLYTILLAAVLAAFGYRITRAGQMTSQYGWLYRRAGPLAWRHRPTVENGAPEGA